MAKNLVIVESPAKAKTINKFIGKDYVVKASVGHVRDLPKSELGVDEKTFEPTYEVLEGKEKMIVDREEEIKAFVPQEYWTFAANLEANNPPPFIAKLSKIDGKKAEVVNEQQARPIESALKSGDFVVQTITRKEKKQSS